MLWTYFFISLISIASSSAWLWAVTLLVQSLVVSVGVLAIVSRDMGLAAAEQISHEPQNMYSASSNGKDWQHHHTSCTVMAVF